MTVSHRNQRRASRQWALLVSLPLVAWAQGGPAKAEGEVYDRAVASVDGRVVTQSQLEFEARVLLVNAGGVEAAFEPLDRETLGRSLELVINQRLALVEADKLDAWPLEPGELERAVAVFRARFPDEGRFRAFLDGQDADVNELAEVLKRSLRAQRALDGKLRLKAQVSEADARREQAARPELKGLPLDLVRQKLFAERFTEAVKAELKQARKAADVRLLGPWSTPTKGSAR